MSALAVFYAGAAAYEQAHHAAHWARQHLPLLLAVTVLTGFAAALYLRHAVTADQRAWHTSTHADDDGPTDLETCRAIWAAGTARRRNTRKGDHR